MRYHDKRARFPDSGRAESKVRCARTNREEARPNA